jgi:hypothetical protein
MGQTNHQALAGAATRDVVRPMPEPPRQPVTAGTVHELEHSGASGEVVEIARDLAESAERH